MEERLNAGGESASMISIFEQKTKDLGIANASFPPSVPTSELAVGHPLADKYQSARVEFKVNNLGIKKILEMAIAIESAPQLYRIVAMKIVALYQNKLFFDAIFEVEGFTSKK